GGTRWPPTMDSICDNSRSMARLTRAINASPDAGGGSSSRSTAERLGPEGPRVRLTLVEAAAFLAGTFLDENFLVGSFFVGVFWAAAFFAATFLVAVFLAAAV